MTKVPYQDQYMDFMRKSLGRSYNTLRTYEERMAFWRKWVIRNVGTDDPHKITKAHILSFRDFVQNGGYAYKTAVVQFNALSMYFKFLVDSEILQDTPIPARMAKRGRAQGLPAPPWPLEIFRMRQKANVKLETALAFEVLLSTGCRIEEFLQSRCFEFNFQDRPFDKELQKPSPYFAGSIVIHPATHQVKGGQPRKVFFSELAGKLIKAYCAKELKPLDSNLTLLPLTESIIYGCFDDLREGIIARTATTVSTGKIAGSVTRQPGYLDIDLTKTPMSPRTRKLIEARQKKEREIPDHLRSHKQIEANRPRTLKPHNFRHAFTNFCYYRNPMGERNDEPHLRMLLGHSDITSTMIYLRTLDMIPDDATWRRLWLGVPEDWLDAFLE